MRDDGDRLADILTAIDRILSKTAQGRPAFDADPMLQVWVLHHLQIVGEAARGLSEQFRRLHPDKVWSKAAGMRTKLRPHKGSTVQPGPSQTLHVFDTTRLRGGRDRTRTW
ncbi:MAG: DUF86 domain-containing protein [Acidobacteria bacterium]|nr:DUF86 domain-containing protein [Acidobacteriota bacterium]